MGVTVYVEECDLDGDDAADEDWTYGGPSPTRLKWAPIPTSLPPMGIAMS